MATISQADSVSALRSSEGDGVAAGIRSPLWLELHHPSGPAVAVAVDQTRCSLGGHRDCTVRVPDGGDRVDCLIIRGPSGAVVRNWSGLTQLNGRVFRDAPLRFGDDLEIAGTRIRVLAREPAPVTAPDVIVDPSVAEGSPQGLSGPEMADLPSHAGEAGACGQERDGHPAARPGTDEHAKRHRLLDRQRQRSLRYRQERDRWDRARMRLERRLGAYTRLAARLQDRIHSELQPRVQQIELKRIQLESRASELEGVRSQYLAAHDEIQAQREQLAEESAAQAAQLAELQQRSEALAVRENQLAEQLSTLQSREVELTERDERLAQRSEELACQAQLLDSQRQQISDLRSLETQRLALDARQLELSQLTEALHQKQHFLNEAQLALDQERAEVQAQSAEAAQQLDSLRRERDVAQDAAKGLQVTLVELQAQLCQEREGHAATACRIAESEQSAQDLQVALRDAHAQVEDLTTRNAVLDQQNASLRQEQELVREAMDRRQAAIDQELDELKAAHEQLIATLRAGEGERSKWEDERGTLQTELQRYRDLEAKWTEAHQKDQSALRHLEEDAIVLRNKWKAEQQRYEQQAEVLQAEIKRMLRGESTRDQERQAVQDELVTLRQERDALQKELDSRRMDAEPAHSDCPTSSFAVVTRELREAELLQTISGLEEQLRSEQQRRADWESEREQLIGGYEHQINEITNLLRNLPEPVNINQDDMVRADAVPGASEPTWVATMAVPGDLERQQEPDSRADEYSQGGLHFPEDPEELRSASDTSDDRFPAEVSTDCSDPDPNTDESNREQREESDHRESIESYMARLLGQVSAASVEAMRDEPAAQREPADSAELPDDSLARRDEPPREKPSMPPKRANPLASADLTAMRELAITSTRLAIEKHEGRRKVFWVVTGFFKVLIALLVGLILIVWGRSIHQSASILGIVAVLGSTYVGYRHFAGKRQKAAGPTPPVPKS